MAATRSESPGETGTELLEALRQSYEVLGRLLDVHRNYLLKIISEEIDPRLKTRQGGSDIVQIALVRVLENFQRATEGIFAVGTEDDLRKWLRQVCLRTLYQEYRDEGREIRDFRKDEPIQDEVAPEANGLSPSSIYSLKERDEILLKTINALPEADRILLRLRVWHNWTYSSLRALLDGEENEAGRVRMQRRITQLSFELGQDDAVSDLKS